MSLKLIILILGLAIATVVFANIQADFLWFAEVGYLSAFKKQLIYQLGLWLIITGVSAFFLLKNLQLAQQLKWHSIPKTTASPQPLSVALRLPILLPIVLGFATLICLMFVYYTQVAYSVWQVDYNLAQVTPHLPNPFAFTSLSQLWQEISQQVWKLAVLITVVIVLIVNPFLLTYITVAISLLFGLTISGNWAVILPNFYPTKFNQVDPQFAIDISFYIFHFPYLQLLYFWLIALFLYGLVAVTLTYLLSANSLSEGKFSGFSQAQLRHICFLGGLVMLTLAFQHWLARYKLLYSPRGVSFGASYTDIKVQLPLENILLIISIAIALWLFYKSINIVRFKIVYWLIKIYLIIVILSNIITETIQLVIVEPNELARETPYIERTIALTKKAFGLDKIEVNTFNPQGQLTATSLEENDLTIKNIRLWDTRPLLQTNRQLQQIRLYYKFYDADIDRYTLKSQTGGEKQQVIIAARELDYSEVPDQAKTWVNEHLVYTHGYGFTMTPVNLVDRGGLPYYFVKDIGTDTESGALRTSNDVIRDSIPIGFPRIYYGELTNSYVMTSTKVKELDYPSGDDNAYNIYDGTGGINIGSLGRRLLFSLYLRDPRMLFTENITPQTRLLFNRDINLRIRKIAPFLYYDSDPYLVVADAGDALQGGSQNYLHWIIDAYTTSQYYPYSEPVRNQINYIRNSVKIVIDAYNGDVDLYVSDASDPVIQTWQAIFPDLFKPLDQMPASLRSHLRYPQDLFKIQSEQLLTYHMSDPKVFYNREDQWQIPKELYAYESLPVEPYYITMKLPTATQEEFIMLHPYTPQSRNNLIALLYGRSDGDEYGKLLLYELPKKRLIYGPEQIEARINQDPDISEQISLWNRQGSRAIQGNLLVIPIEESFVYVEPLYLEAQENSLPTLVRVIVVYEDKIVMRNTLTEAFQVIFGS